MSIAVEISRDPGLEGKGPCLMGGGGAGLGRGLDARIRLAVLPPFCAVLVEIAPKVAIYTVRGNPRHLYVCILGYIM